MAKRYYNLEKETKAYLKACSDSGIVPAISVSAFNNYIINTKAKNNNSEFLKINLLDFNNLDVWLDASINTSYPASGATWYDLSVKGNNATLLNTPIFSGEFGGLLNLNPRNNRYASLNYNLGLDFTIQITARNETNLFWSTLFGSEFWNSSLGVLAYFDTNSTLQFKVGGGSTGISASGLDSTKINVYTFTHSSAGVANIYVNGVLSSTGSFNFTPASTGTYIGSRHANTGTGSTDPWGGSIFNFKIYNKVLTASEILNNFKSIKGRFNL